MFHALNITEQFARVTTNRSLIESAWGRRILCAMHKQYRQLGPDHERQVAHAATSRRRIARWLEHSIPETEAGMDL